MPKSNEERRSIIPPKSTSTKFGTKKPRGRPAAAAAAKKKKVGDIDADISSSSEESVDDSYPSKKATSKGRGLLLPTKQKHETPKVKSAAASTAVASGKLAAFNALYGHEEDESDESEVASPSQEQSSNTAAAADTLLNMSGAKYSNAEWLLDGDSSRVDCDKMRNEYYMNLSMDQMLDEYTPLLVMAGDDKEILYQFWTQSKINQDDKTIEVKAADGSGSGTCPVNKIRAIVCCIECKTSHEERLLTRCVTCLRPYCGIDKFMSGCFGEKAHELEWVQTSSSTNHPKFRCVTCVERCGKAPKPALIPFMTIHDKFVLGDVPPPFLMKKTTAGGNGDNRDGGDGNESDGNEFDNIPSRGGGGRDGNAGHEGNEYEDDGEEEDSRREDPTVEEVAKVWSGKAIANHPDIKNKKNVTWDAKGKRELFLSLFGKKRSLRPSIKTIFDTNILSIEGVQGLFDKICARVYAYTPTFDKLSLKEWDCDATEFMMLLHKQHCEEDFCHCEGGGSSDVRKSIAVRDLIELVDACHGVAKNKLISENSKKENATKRAVAAVAKGTGGRSVTWDEAKLADMECPWCTHRSLIKDKSDDEVQAEIDRRRKRHAEDVAKYDQVPPGVKKKKGGKKNGGAPRPRLNLNVTVTYNCACIHRSGFSCSLCKGKKRDECMICNCLCSAGPMQRKDFQSIARQRIAKENGMEEDEAHRTVAQKRNVFGDILRNSVSCGSQDCRFAGVEAHHHNIAGASSHYVANAELEDDIQKQMADDVGVPTDYFEDGTNVEQYQSRSVGQRFYDNKLGGSSGRTGPPQLRRTGGHATKAAPARQSSTAASAIRPRHQQQPPPARQSSTAAASAIRPRHRQQPPPAPAPSAVQNHRSAWQQPPQQQGMYNSPVPNQQISTDERFERRTVGALARDGQNDPTSIKRKKRVYEGLAADGNNVTKVLVKGYVTNGSPPAGESQDAAKTLMMIHATPQKENDNNEEE